MAVPSSSPPDAAAARSTSPGAAAAPDRLIDLKEVRRRTGIGRATIDKLIAAGTFPRKVYVSPVIVRWSAKAVDAWIEERIAAATGPGR